MRDPWSLLTPKQQDVTKAFLDERERERTHLVIYLSGAHAYGFPSPDSDLDLKCVHIAPTRELVGLEVNEDAPERIDVVDGVELDYGSNELAPVLRGIIRGNGNFIERILGDLVLGGDHALLAEARTIVKPLLSRRVIRHYVGFAASQLRMFGEKPTAKRALYVLRTTATGLHMVAHGECVTDLGQLAAFLPREADELRELKRRSEREPLPLALAQILRETLAAAIDSLDKAWPAAVVPADPPREAVAAADAWLREVRRRHW